MMRVAVPAGLGALLFVTLLGTADGTDHPRLRHAEKQNPLFEDATLGRSKLNNVSLQASDSHLQGTFHQEPARRLALTGSETFLGIAVVASGCNPACSPPPTVATIANDLYGDTVNLVTVTAACSFGKFTVGPAPDINGNVLATPGVYQVTITQDVFNASTSAALDFVDAELAKAGELGPSFKDGADKIIYFLPPELLWPTNPTGNPAPGWASGNSLVLNVGFYSSTRGHVHEYFHTLGLNHATEGGRGKTEYGDTTGQMGGSASGDESGQKCFNGPHNWFLGWYDDRHDEISSPGIIDTSGTYQLVGLSEYDLSTAGVHTVVLKVGLGFPDYYVSFNRDTGINQDTGEYRNLVLLHMVISGDLDPKSFTDLRAAMTIGDKFPIPGGEIEVVNIDTTVTPGVATVNVNRIIPSGKLDVFFLIDDTGSFQDDIELFKGIVEDVIEDIQDEGDDVHFGLGIFRDFPQGDYGEPDDFPYMRLVPISADGDGDGAQAVIDQTQLLMPDGGKDVPESQLAALLRAVAGPDDAQFRVDAAKFIVLWTDSGFHDSGIEEDYPGPRYNDTLFALQAAGVPFRFRARRGLGATQQSVRVLGIARPGEVGFDDAVAYLEALATDTGTVAPPGGVDCSGDGSDIIPEGEPIVCTSGTGSGIAPAMSAAVKAVIEVIRPKALCKKAVAEAEEGECSVATASIDDESSDPSNLAITLEQIPEGRYSVGLSRVTLSVTNTEGLVSYCFAEIEVKDKEEPVLKDVPTDETVECDHVPEPPVVWATDNCVTLLEDPPKVLFEEVRTDGDCDFNYVLTRTWSAQDPSSNEASETIVVTVEDTTPPEVACNVFDISPDDVNMQSPIVFTPTATDNCEDQEDLVVLVESYKCYRVNKKGKTIAANCKIELVGDSASVFISGGVGTQIDFDVTATQPCGNLQTEVTCSVNVVNPSQNP